jgi:hypothetical protein
MSFTVFPDVAIGPLSLGPGQISEPLVFPETAGGTPPEVILRIIMLGDGCEPPHAEPPTFTVRAGQGVPVEPPEGRMVFVRARPEDASDPVAKTQLFIESEHVYAIRLRILRPGSTWQLRITNRDDAARKFAWVVADNEAESAQPCLNLPPTLHFDGEVSQDITRSLDVRNLGTGFLTMSLGGLEAGSKFQLDQVPTDVAPNHCGKLIITFHAPTSASTIEPHSTTWAWARATPWIRQPTGRSTMAPTTTRRASRRFSSWRARWLHAPPACVAASISWHSGRRSWECWAPRTS